MFVNAVEDFGLEEYERPNWINFVRSPIERHASQFYFNAYPHEEPNTLLKNLVSILIQNNMYQDYYCQTLYQQYFRLDNVP